MTDRNLGRASGDVEINYDGSELRQATGDLDAVSAASERADKSTGKLNERLRDSRGRFVFTGQAAGEAADETKRYSEETARSTREMEAAGTKSDGYKSRLRDLANAARDVKTATKAYDDVLLDHRSTLSDIEEAEDRVTEAKKRHARASDIAADSHRAYAGTLAKILPNIPALDGWASRLAKSADITDNATGKANKLSTALSLVAKAAMLLGQPGIAAGAEGVARGIDTIDAAARKAVGGVQALAGFEATIGKISTITLGITSLGGLTGLAGSAGVMGIVEMADAVRQLSGVLGLLPATISGVVFAAGTLQIAFHGVGDALTDMMADDPKKFLEDIKNMGPIAAQAMIGIAQFRDQIRMAGGAIQDSFFAQIASDITPLIQTWLPAVTAGMSQVAGVFGQAAHEFARLLQQPQAMAVFQRFVDDISRGLQALIPALDPLLYTFEQLTVAGSAFFEQIGTKLTGALNTLADMVQQAASSGALQRWIQMGINSFERLGHIIFNVGSAFGTIMDSAEQFGGGGLLQWLQDITKELATWTQSGDGQNALTNFFSLMRKATDAFLPMLPLIMNGLSSLGSAFVQLGVATSPAWMTFFDTFSQVMANLGPHIAATAPAISDFIRGMATGFEKFIDTIGPQLPAIFQGLADSFVALVPQIQPLTHAFIEIVEGAGPELPGLFAAVTDALKAMEPFWPLITDVLIIFVNALRLIVEAGATVLNWIHDFLGMMDRIPGALKEAFSMVGDYLGKIFGGLAHDAEEWGKNLLRNLAKGLADSLGVDGVLNAAKNIANIISDFWKTKSPAARGPLHDMSPNQMGANVVRNFAAGISAAHPMLAVAAGRAAGSVVGALSGRGSRGGAPSPGGRSTADGALLPDNIAGADTSILTAYLRHQFSDSRGLKGLAKDLGNALQVVQSGFNLVTQQGITPILQALGMVPGLNNAGWRKLSPSELAAQQQSNMEKQTIQAQKKGPTWTDVMGPSSSPAGGADIPLGLTGASGKEEIQKAIIAAGRARGMNDAAIQTALAVAAAESGFNPTISGGVQGSAGLVSGLYQQSPSSGWGTLDQVNDPNHAINAFYDAFAKQLQQIPNDPMLAAVLTQNPQLGSGAPGSAYMRAVQDQLGLANSIMGAYGKDTKGPSWAQLTGGSSSAAAGAALIAAARSGAPSIAENPASQALRVPNAPNVEAGIRQMGGLPGTLYPTTGPNAYQVPEWANQLAKAFGLTASTYSNGGSLHQMGYAFDFNDPNSPNGSSAKLDAFAEFISKNLAAQTLQLIHASGDRRWGIASGQDVSNSNYFAGDYAGHNDHVHWGTDVPVLINGQIPPNSMVGGAGLGNTGGTSLVLPSGRSLDELTDNTARSATVNEQLLQSYLQGNPALAQQIQAAKVPGADDNTVMGALNGITSTIDTLKQQDAVGNKNTIQALQSAQSGLAQQQGFTQNQQGPIDAVSSVLGSAGNAVSSVFQAIQGGLDAMTATQDIADRLVYGIRNTEDINKIVDNVQKYISFAADIANATGQILSSIGSVVGAGAGADPSGGASGAAAGLQTAGQIASLVSGVLQGVNAAIDFGQQIYEITMSYAGRFMSYLTGLGGTELMGNVGFLLNKNTGQLLSYSMDNPLQKNVAEVPSWMRYFYDYNGRGNANPGVGQLNIWASPGQSPAGMLNEAMWLVNTGGTTGALSPANF